jgi:hypothetical protein
VAVSSSSWALTVIPAGGITPPSDARSAGARRLRRQGRPDRHPGHAAPTARGTVGR